MCIGCAQTGLTASDSLGLDPAASKIIAMGAAAVMLIGALTPLANSTTQVKARAVCVKSNQKVVKNGQSFVCKKSGKKLVWRLQKPKVEKVVTQPDVPRPDTPLETKLKSAYSSLSAQDKQYSTIFETPVVSGKNRMLFDEFNKHLKWMAGMGATLTRPLVVLVPDTADWMNAEISRQGCPPHRLSLGGYAIWGDCGGKAVITRPNSDRELNAPANTIEAQHGLIHEAFHQWQREAVVPGLGNSDYPKWIWEGGANAISRYAFWASSGTKLSPEQLLQDWYSNQRHDLRTSCIGVKIREMVPNTPWPDKANCAYSKGQVAIDLYIEKFGVPSFFSLYKKPKSPGMQSFSQIFKSETGQELEDFYTEVDLEMTKRGWE